MFLSRLLLRRSFLFLVLLSRVNEVHYIIDVSFMELLPFAEMLYFDVFELSLTDFPLFPWLPIPSLLLRLSTILATCI